MTWISYSVMTLEFTKLTLPLMSHVTRASVKHKLNTSSIGQKCPNIHTLIRIKWYCRLHCLTTNISLTWWMFV